jgi:S-formylglutathione hydrolase FrmB
MHILIPEEDGRGSVVNFRHESDILKGNPLGDPHVRDLFVYLPPSYSDGEQRYPVVFCLSGFTGRGKMFLNDHAFAPNLAERMNGLISDRRVQPMILVMPDCFTWFGGSQYINSTATGRYEDHLTQEIVPFIDANLRTVADRGARAVMGKSSGGYGALIMGLRHADLFGLVCSTAGDCYFEYCYMQDVSKALRAIDGDPVGFMRRFWEKEKKRKDDFAAVNFIGMSACYSPDGEAFDIPFDLETGEMRADVWNRWLEHDPVRLVERHEQNLKSLRLLFIDAGTRDEFALDLGARILSKRLTDHGIEHIHEEFDGGHFDIAYRQNSSLEIISQRISE